MEVNGFHSNISPQKIAVYLGFKVQWAPQITTRFATADTWASGGTKKPQWWDIWKPQIWHTVIIPLVCPPKMWPLSLMGILSLQFYCPWIF